MLKKDSYAIFLFRLTALACFLFLSGGCAGKNITATTAAPLDEWTDDEWADEDELFVEHPEVYDPLEGLNRKVFVFNDKLYFWVVKPVAEAYEFIVPVDIRLSFRMAVDNVFFPIRVVNNLLQGKVENASIETVRFVVNSTLGLGGLTDPAGDLLDLQPKQEDFGQTLGVYGVGAGPYLCLPFLGPLNIRDGAGVLGDYLLNPALYLTWDNIRVSAGYYSTEKINRASLVLGKYEKFVEESFDPYIAIRDAYNQNRNSKIADSGLTTQGFFIDKQLLLDLFNQSIILLPW